MFGISLVRKSHILSGLWQAFFGLGSVLALSSEHYRHVFISRQRYDALRDYADLAESGQHTEYFLYNRFKMSLYTDEVRVLINTVL